MVIFLAPFIVDIRSAYFLELNESKKDQATSSEGSKNLVWRKLWEANIPTKIRIFGWKAMHHGLPMRTNLWRRGCVEDCICPMCGEKNETTSHALLSCPEAQEVWEKSPLRLTCQSAFEGTMLEWVQQISKNINEKVWWDLLWSLLWGIWLRRNAWLFEHRKIDTVEVIEKAVNLVHKYKRTMEDEPVLKGVPQGGEKIWRAPSSGRVKINSDVAVFGDGKLGFGGVARD